MYAEAGEIGNEEHGIRKKFLMNLGWTAVECEYLIKKKMYLQLIRVYPVLRSLPKVILL